MTHRKQTVFDDTQEANAALVAQDSDSTVTHVTFSLKIIICYLVKLYNNYSGLVKL